MEHNVNSRTVEVVKADTFTLVLTKQEMIDLQRAVASAAGGWGNPDIWTEIANIEIPADHEVEPMADWERALLDHVAQPGDFWA